MRLPIVAGNWKMFKTLQDSVEFIQTLAPRLEAIEGVERVVCPTYVALASVANVLENSAVKVGAQNVHWEKEGAYTSQISPQMLVGLAEYVIIGHSECRAYLGDTDEIVNRKVKAALGAGLKPILAVGENLDQNEQGETVSFVSGQVRAGLSGVTAEEMAHVVIAYEPIWAIGTGKSASGDVANDIIRRAVRDTLRELYGDDIAEEVRIQYGGSVKPENMAEYMSKPDIDGALVGGASLKTDDFVRLVEIAASAKGQ